MTPLPRWVLLAMVLGHATSDGIRREDACVDLCRAAETTSSLVGPTYAYVRGLQSKEGHRHEADRLHELCQATTKGRRSTETEKDDDYRPIESETDDDDDRPILCRLLQGIDLRRLECDCESLSASVERGTSLSGPAKGEIKDRTIEDSTSRIDLDWGTSGLISHPRAGQLLWDRSNSVVGQRDPVVVDKLDREDDGGLRRRVEYEEGKSIKEDPRDGNYDGDEHRKKKEDKTIESSTSMIDFNGESPVLISRPRAGRLPWDRSNSFVGQGDAVIGQREPIVVFELDREDDEGRRREFEDKEDKSMSQDPRDEKYDGDEYGKEEEEEKKDNDDDEEDKMDTNVFVVVVVGETNEGGVLDVLKEDGNLPMPLVEEKRIDKQPPSSSSNEEVDWEMWCATQCDNGHGGSACNCDIIP